MGNVFVSLARINKTIAVFYTCACLFVQAWLGQGQCWRLLSGHRPAYHRGLCKHNGFADLDLFGPSTKTSWKFLNLGEDVQSNVALRVLRVSDKQALSVSCGLRWHCAGACTMSLASACPDGWAFVGGLCHAPTRYSGSSFVF